MKKQNVNIALIQFESTLADTAANTARAVQFCTEAAEHESDIICLPEMFSTGYNLDMIGEKIPHMAQKSDGETITALQEISRQWGCCIIAPIVLEKELRGLFYNSAVILEDGRIIGIYDKNHLWAQEKFFFCSGDDYPVFQTKYGKIGVMICRDAGYPEAARILTLCGAEIIFCPAAWRSQDIYMWDINLRQRALENNLFVAGVNRYGHEGELYMCGDSKIVDPLGKVIAQLADEADKILYAQLDLSAIERSRAYVMYLQDRRPEQYSLLCKRNPYCGI